MMSRSNALGHGGGGRGEGVAGTACIFLMLSVASYLCTWKM